MVFAVISILHQPESHRRVHLWAAAAALALALDFVQVRLHPPKDEGNRRHLTLKQLHVCASGRVCTM